MTSTSSSEPEAGWDVELASDWSLYFHDPDNSDWSIGGYVRVHTVRTARDFWSVQSAMSGDTCKAMWFLMRGDVPPIWDAPSNASGGFISYVVPKSAVDSVWAALCEVMLCECMRADGGADSEEINGASVSPKNDFCIVKIWMRSSKLGEGGRMRPLHGLTNGIFTPTSNKLAGDARRAR